MATHSVIAVDWSGATDHGRSRKWLAEAQEPGALVRLEPLPSGEPLLGNTRLPTGVVAVGLDFAFSFPAWFIEQCGVRSGPDLWAHVTQHGENWLVTCAEPFWGCRGHPRPVIPEPVFRRTELAVPRTGGIAPKSIFQIGGAGSVGTGSIRGIPLLHTLWLAGATIWPFTRAGAPTVVEIYPRLLTGAVRKSDANARAAYVNQHFPELDPEHLRLAVASEDAFDAAVSALVMIDHLEDLRSLPVEADAELHLEGRIWHPRWREDRL